MSINISIKSGFGAGLLIGVLLGIAIASLWLVPQPPCADAQPKPKDTEGDDDKFAEWREGVERKATGTHGR